MGLSEGSWVAFRELSDREAVVFFFQLMLVFINKWLCFVVCFLLLLGLWFWKVGQLITQQQIAICTSWRVMKTATEDMVFLTVTSRDSAHDRCSIVDAGSCAEAAGTWLQFLLIYCGWDSGRTFVLSGMIYLAYWTTQVLNSLVCNLCT